MARRYKRTARATRSADYLNQIAYRNGLVKQYSLLLAEKKSLIDGVKGTRSDIESIKGGASMPDKIGEAIAELEELERILNEHMLEEIKIINEAMRIIGKIKSAEGRSILIGRYIERKSIKELRIDFDHETEWIFIRLNNALDEFGEIYSKSKQLEKNRRR